VSRKEGNRIGLMTITVISIFLVAGSLTAGWPWDYRVSYLKGPERYVTFKQEAVLYLLSTEDNGPLENLAFYYLAPHIENRPITDTQGNPASKSMYHIFYLEENGALLIETWSTDGEHWDVCSFYGQRTEIPCRLRNDIVFWPEGPTAITTINKLYPREVLWVVDVLQVPEKNAKEVTITKQGENRSTGGFGYDNGSEIKSFEKNATVYLWINLAVLGEDNIFRSICQYSRRVENIPSVTAVLYPL